jgi:cell division protein FtsN
VALSSRRDFKNSGRDRREGRDRRDQPAGRRGGNLLLGVALGMAGALLLVGVLAWFLYARPGEFKTPDQVPAVTTPAAPRPSEAPPVAEPPAPPSPAPAPAEKAGAPAEKAKEAAPSYSFYDILPGSKPPKPVEPPKAKELWWLQVAALKTAEDADRLKARLALLNLDTVVQRVQSGDATLYRVRVGPFKNEDAALGALDTLAVNNFEPRLLKEAVNP